MKSESSSVGQQHFAHENAEIGKRSQIAPAFYRLRDVLQITSLSRPTLYRRIAAHRFPAPVHLGGRATAWASASLRSWIDDPEGYRAPCIDVPAAPRRRGRPRKYTPG